MTSLAHSLVIYDVASPKIRLGCGSDGGYIINQALLENSNRLVTLGYGNEDSFEIDWYERTNTAIDIYDGTCTCGTICNRYPNLMGSTLHYHNRNVGNAPGNIPLSEILQNKSGVLLKVDIEGGEYSVFDSMDFSSQSGVLIEFHTLHIEHNRNKFAALLENELRAFLPFHIHANNWTGEFDLDGVQFPQTVEISLINKALVSTSKVDSAIYPIVGLDFPNNVTMHEISLPWVNAAQR
jgi:hypothetical protein